MTSYHNALITWSNEHVRAGLLDSSEIVDPAWFVEQGQRSGEGWSLRCRFEAPANRQGNPTRALIHFMTDNAPHERLKPGSTLHMFERATGKYASVAVLD
jgi:hypothetical protein